jgi:predicted membrane protein
MEKQFSKKRFWGGLLFISVGALLLLKNLNLLPAEIPPYVFSWQMLLVAVGVVVLLASRRSWFGGTLLIGIGGYFLIPEILHIPKSEVLHFWPALLVIAGIGMLSKIYAQPKKKFWKIKTENLNDDYMESTVIFGGGSRQVSSYDYKGGKITAIFGGLEIDLTNCCLSKEKNVIEIEAIFGGVTLTVPKDWNVKTDITPIMGGVYDNIQEMPGTYVDPAAELTIRGTVVMGGVEIKRA